MLVSVELHWQGIRQFELSHITKNWIVIKWNDIASYKFSRKDGYEAGAFSSRQNLTPGKIIESELAKLNELAEKHGGLLSKKQVSELS